MRLSRRTVLMATSAGLVAATGSRGRAQPPTSDGFHILEASRRTEPPSGFTYQGNVPGPTIRVAQGDELRVRLINRLDQPTTLHWHGCRPPNAMDGAAGVTQEAVPAGASFDYRFKTGDSGTFWYHPGIFTDRMQQIEIGRAHV
jgi:FtsP/CotA-like multicopper oxidase with cupredoxin domain